MNVRYSASTANSRRRPGAYGQQVRRPGVAREATMSENTVNTTDATVDETPEVTHFSDLSPYNAHLLVNELMHLQNDGRADVRPQMMYGYAKRYVIKSYCSTGDGV